MPTEFRNAAAQLTRRGLLAGAGAIALLVAGMTGVQAQSTLERIQTEGKITIGIHNGVPWGVPG